MIPYGLFGMLDQVKHIAKEQRAKLKENPDWRGMPEPYTP
jgi:hypothetical protein